MKLKYLKIKTLKGARGEAAYRYGRCLGCGEALADGRLVEFYTDNCEPWAHRGPIYATKTMSYHIRTNGGGADNANFCPDCIEAAKVETLELTAAEVRKVIDYREYSQPHGLTYKALYRIAPGLLLRLLHRGFFNGCGESA